MQGLRRVDPFQTGTTIFVGGSLAGAGETQLATRVGFTARDRRVGGHSGESAFL